MNGELKWFNFITDIILKYIFLIIQKRSCVESRWEKKNNQTEQGEIAQFGLSI